MIGNSHSKTSTRNASSIRDVLPYFLDSLVNRNTLSQREVLPHSDPPLSTRITPTYPDYLNSEQKISQIAAMGSSYVIPRQSRRDTTDHITISDPRNLSINLDELPITRPTTDLNTKKEEKDTIPNRKSQGKRNLGRSYQLIAVPGPLRELTLSDEECKHFSVKTGTLFPKTVQIQTDPQVQRVRVKGPAPSRLRPLTENARIKRNKRAHAYSAQLKKDRKSCKN